MLFGPEKMLEFAFQMGKLVRKIKQEWASLQMEMEMERLREELKKRSAEGEEKVRGKKRGKETDDGGAFREKILDCR